MIVEPYKRAPEPPTVALLTADGGIVDERGRSYGPAGIPDGVRVWSSYETVRELVNDGAGEALCWNGDEIKWRHDRAGDSAGVWKPRPTDVNVVKLPFPDDPGRGLDALATWRDWLRRHGAAPTGTTGSASMSLLRAKLTAPLFCTMGEAPPLKQTMGGRLEMGPAGPGSFTGRIEQWDMPAAYAAELGRILYNGRWHIADDLPVKHPPDWWAAAGRPVFVKARVRVPDGTLGPLIRRPRKRMTMMAAHVDAMVRPRYPAGTFVGLWTWEELEQAIGQGARVLELVNVWVHINGRPVFAPWWEAVQDGRKARGLAGALAKMTGNALWGRFCMDVRVQGDRTIRRRPKGRRTLTHEPIPKKRGGPLPAHDLAETVSGRVRARLYRALVAAGDDLISAHTDGLWVRHSDACRLLEETGWRQKAAARRIDVIDPQTLRYWPRRRQEPEYVMAGRTAKEAPAAFEALWKGMGISDEHDND